jgi:hypothetical protein
MAGITADQISNKAKNGFILATKLKPGMRLTCIIDTGDDHYSVSKDIKSVDITPSGKLVHIEVCADEPIEVKSTEYIQIL